ncbi:MAG: hypothetical protein KA027_01925 [Candidatus Methanofastidiosum sp.]|nr:hypothetical protein [Methanofastidiosum sp.]
MPDVNDQFKQFADQVAQEEADRASKKGGFTANYEKVKWTGLEQGKTKIIRALGGVPNSGDSPFTARVVRIAYVLDDKGKRMKVVLPNQEKDPQYLMWRIIDRVMEPSWTKEGDKNVKSYPVQAKHPDIFEIVAHNGLPESNVKRKYGLEGRGWQGREFLLMNCIDRGLAFWHKENKHSVLLSKKVTLDTNKDGNPVEYIEEGVPSFGFVNILASTIFRYYGDWRNYDIGIEKTGQQSTPIIVKNASKHIEEIADNLKNLVVDGPLTEEEKAYEMYDLDKLYGVTTYTKLYNRLRLTISKIDLALGTHYSDELKSMADEEAKNREALKARQEQEEAMDVPDEDHHVAQEETPVTTRPAPQAEVRTRPSPENQVKEEAEPVTKLPYFDRLNDNEKSKIKSIKKVGEDYQVEYVGVNGEQMYKCNNCTTHTPESFHVCPNCGIFF